MAIYIPAPVNNRTKSRKIIEAAAAAGELDDLLYGVDMLLPPSLRPSPGVRSMAATYPAGWSPVVPLAPDPEVAGHLAEILHGLLVEANQGRGITFVLSLTARRDLDRWGLAYYEWGEDIPVRVDAVCPVCGAVGRVAAGAALDCCPPVSPLGAGAGVYAGQWWGGL